MLFSDPIIPYSVQRAYRLIIDTATAVSGGFSGAAVFRATTSDGRQLSIRRTPKSVALPPERMRRLHRLLHQISDSGCRIIPVPFTPANTGMQVHRSENRSVVPWLHEKNCIWQIEPWMPGSLLDGRELTLSHLRAALIALNHFHQLATEGVRVVGPDEWFLNATGPSPAVQRRLAIVDELQAGGLRKLSQQLGHDPDEKFRSLAGSVCETLTSWLPWLQRELNWLALIAFPIQPVLRDIWRVHVLFTDGEVTGLIDLSAAASDHVTVDLARLTRSWFGSDISRLQSAVTEYESLRVLSGDERRLWQALDASTVLLSPVTWLRRRVESAHESDCPGDVIARLTELTANVRSFRPLPLMG